MEKNLQLQHLKVYIFFLMSSCIIDIIIFLSEEVLMTFNLTLAPIVTGRRDRCVGVAAFVQDVKSSLVFLSPKYDVM